MDQATPKIAKRSIPTSPTRELYPIHRATQMTACALYWLPASRFPVPVNEREWLMRFLHELGQLAMLRFGLRTETFLQVKIVADGDLKEVFHRNQTELMPMMGLSRRPGAKLPPIPSEEDLEPIIKGRQKFVFDQYIADYCFWFLKKDPKRLSELFFGYGGMTMMFLKPDPKTIPPVLPFSSSQREHALFKHFDVEALVASAFALADEFGAKSKEIFGKGLENDPQFPGLMYILPTLTTNDFFVHQPTEVKRWFELFGIYFNESPIDGGIVFASAEDLDADLLNILARMREEGHVYSR